MVEAERICWGVKRGWAQKRETKTKADAISFPH